MSSFFPLPPPFFPPSYMFLSYSQPNSFLLTSPCFSFIFFMLFLPPFFHFFPAPLTIIPSPFTPFLFSLFSFYPSLSQVSSLPSPPFLTSTILYPFPSFLHSFPPAYSPPHFPLSFFPPSLASLSVPISLQATSLLSLYPFSSSPFPYYLPLTCPIPPFPPYPLPFLPFSLPIPLPLPYPRSPFPYPRPRPSISRKRCHRREIFLYESAKSGCEELRGLSERVEAGETSYPFDHKG